MEQIQLTYFWIVYYLTLYSKITYYLTIQNYQNFTLLLAGYGTTILIWWFTLFILGIIFWPFTSLLFNRFSDKGYAFSKVVGLASVSYVAFILGILHVLPFFQVSLFTILIISLVVNFFISKRKTISIKSYISKLVIFEELMFGAGIFIWAYIRSFEPSIHSLEKYMDFGFVNSILRSDYFPPSDMWFTPFPINYYYFGHLSTAVLIKLSNIAPNIAYNLMIATLFAFALTLSFSFLYQLLVPIVKKRRAFIGGILGGLLLSIGGNLHTIYSFYSKYVDEKPVPLSELQFLPKHFPNAYWYPNATRFIHNTIHEFPLYSFVVSDLHGHVIDIPYVLLTIALLYTILIERKLTKLKLVVISILLGIMYMTNIWDGAIYMLLTIFVVLGINAHKLKAARKVKNKFSLAFIHSLNNKKVFFLDIAEQILLIVAVFVLSTLPFNIAFKPFSSGIGVLCAPDFLTNIKNIGPILFEPNHCQKSPFYQLVTLYGFFYAFVFLFIVFKITQWFNFGKKFIKKSWPDSDIFIVLLMILSTILIIAPEFIYAKDIYPEHYRANTMFKLVYQSFMMLSLTSAYVIISVLYRIKLFMVKVLFLTITIPLLCLVFLYPYFAVSSYYGDLRKYTGLDGTAYLKTLYPGDLEAINYLNKNVSGQPIVLEAQGDSYTDYERISANTGLPTVLGWTVHEWLWRGSYDIPSPRIEEVKTMYEGERNLAFPLINKYRVKYVIVGPLERQKYPNLNLSSLQSFSKEVFRSQDNQTTIYEVLD